MPRIKMPCYDKEKHKGCPNRKVGCRSSCPAWQRYEEEYHKLLAKRLYCRVEEGTTVDYEVRNDVKLMKRRGLK